MTCTRGLPYRGSVAACLFILDTTSASRHNAIDSNGPGYQSPGQQPPAFRSTATDLLVCARGTGRPGPRFRRQVLTDHLCSRVSYPFTSDEFHPSLIRDGQHDSGEVGTDRVVLRETEKRYFLPHPSKHDTEQSSPTALLLSTDRRVGHQHNSLLLTAMAAVCNPTASAV